jgi:hypothetical protein
VAWIESIKKATKAARRVLSFVIQVFHHSSGVCAGPDVEDCRDPALVDLSSRALGGESSADFPINDRPLRMRVIVVA